MGILKRNERNFFTTYNTCLKVYKVYEFSIYFSSGVRNLGRSKIFWGGGNNFYGGREVGGGEITQGMEETLQS